MYICPHPFSSSLASRTPGRVTTVLTPSVLEVLATSSSYGIFEHGGGNMELDEWMHRWCRQIHYSSWFKFYQIHPVLQAAVTSTHCDSAIDHSQRARIILVEICGIRITHHQNIAGFTRSRLQGHVPHACACPREISVQHIAIQSLCTGAVYLSLPRKL